EVFVGWPAVKAVIGNKIMPAVLDRILADAGYDGQITSEPLPPNPCFNLHEPCDTDPGAHGRFDREARVDSLQWWMTSHRGLVAGIAAACIGAAALALRK